MTFLPGFLGGGRATVSYQGTNTGAGATPTTFAGQAIGAASPERLVAVALTYSSSSPIGSVTIGGIAATKVVGISGLVQSEIWVAPVPTGTTANIVLGAGTSVGARFAISVYAIYGASSATPIATATSSANPGTGTLACSANCAAIGGFAIGNLTPVRSSWTGLIEDNDADVAPTLSYSAASAQDINGNLAVTVTPSAGVTAVAFAAAAWSP